MASLEPVVKEIVGMVIAFAIFASIIGVLLYRSRFKQRRESG